MRSQPARATCQAMIASEPYSATDAAVCPDGKLEVGGAESSRGTDGRCRSTSSVVPTKIVTSPITLTARKIGSRQRPSRQRSRTKATRPIAITVMVSAPKVASG